MDQDGPRPWLVEETGEALAGSSVSAAGLEGDGDHKDRKSSSLTWREQRRDRRPSPVCYVVSLIVEHELCSYYKCLSVCSP